MLVVESIVTSVSFCSGLNMSDPESGTIWRYGLVRIDVALLKEVCAYRGRL